MNQDRSTTITHSQIKEGYKQTEVGIIPEDWTLESIQEFANIKTGPFGTLLKASEYTGYSGVPLISVGEIRNGFFRINEHTPFVPDIVIRRLPQYVLRKGDIVFGRKGAVERSALVEAEQEGWFLGSDGISIRPSIKCHAKYLAFQFQSHRVISWLIQNAIGTTMASLNQEILSKVVIPLPPTKAEQEAIACTLSDIDALIESLDRLLTKKRQIKQGAMQELLRSKDGWEKKRIGDVLTIAHGRSQHEVVDENGDYPILASGGQIGRAITYLYNKPSVLIGRKGTIDKPQYMDRPFWTVDTLFYSVIHEPNNAKYLFYQFCLIPWREYNEASGVPSLNARTIESIEITVPSPKEQIEIANILSDMDAEIGSIKSKLTKTRQLKQGMMHELLTGRIRLVDYSQGKR
jgi:type I restriction enzyme, S subunit